MVEIRVWGFRARVQESGALGQWREFAFSVYGLDSGNTFFETLARNPRP